MESEKLERLTGLSHLLEAAGSGDAVITLNARDAGLLGIIDNKEKVEIQKQYVQAEDGKPITKTQKLSVPAVQKCGNNNTYEVNVGFARAALEKALDGNKLVEENRVKPEPIVKPEPEPAVS